MLKIYKTVCENLGWTLVEDENGTITLSKFSPAGEDFSFTVNKDDFVYEIGEFYDSFDTEEHIGMWIEAKNNGVRGVPSIKELVEDADAINIMLRDLVDALDMEREHTNNLLNKQVTLFRENTRDLRLSTPAGRLSIEAFNDGDVAGLQILVNDEIVVSVDCIKNDRELKAFLYKEDGDEPAEVFNINRD